jgi:hypothetical protein
MTLKLTGKKFGRLTVQNQNAIGTSSGAIRWNCICDCGSKVTVIGSRLINSGTTSCGCYNKEVVTTHGMSYTKTYLAWENVIQRCTNPKATGYKIYGAKGIRVCNRWSDSFENFLEDMGPKPPGRSMLKRIQTDGDYQKSNCRWIIYNESSSGVHI